MNKEKLEVLLKKEIEKSNSSMTIGFLENLMEDIFKEDEKVNYIGMWIFQGKDILDEKIKFSNIHDIVKYFVNNLDNYLKLYLEFEGDIEPAGYADVYLSYTLKDDDRNKFISVLNDIENIDINIENLADIRDIIDTIPIMRYGEIVENIQLDNLTILR